MGSFSAKVSDWCREQPERIVAVRNEATQRILAIAQTPVAAGGNMPVDTNFLRASLVVTIGENVPPKTYKPDGVERFTTQDTDLSLTLSGAGLETTITAAWTASYAKYVEFGGENRPARRFRDLAAQQWPRVVSEVAKEAQARSGG